MPLLSVNTIIAIIISELTNLLSLVSHLVVVGGFFLYKHICFSEGMIVVHHRLTAGFFYIKQSCCPKTFTTQASLNLPLEYKYIKSPCFGVLYSGHLELTLTVTYLMTKQYTDLTDRRTHNMDVAINVFDFLGMSSNSWSAIDISCIQSQRRSVVYDIIYHG